MQRWIVQDYNLRHNAKVKIENVSHFSAFLCFYVFAFLHFQRSLQNQG